MSLIEKCGEFLLWAGVFVILNSLVILVALWVIVNLDI